MKSSYNALLHLNYLTWRRSKLTAGQETTGALLCVRPCNQGDFWRTATWYSGAFLTRTSAITVLRLSVTHFPIEGVKTCRNTHKKGNKNGDRTGGASKQKCYPLNSINDLAHCASMVQCVFKPSASSREEVVLWRRQSGRFPIRPFVWRSSGFFLGIVEFRAFFVQSGGHDASENAGGTRSGRYINEQDWYFGALESWSTSTSSPLNLTSKTERMCH